MGVDLEVYRSRIGGFSRGTGFDVCHMTVALDFSQWLKTNGAVTFIITLLLMAGIEPNPGPNDKDDTSTREGGRFLLVDNFDSRDMFENILEFIRGAQVGQDEIVKVSMHKEGRSALIEFSNTKATDFVGQTREIDDDGSKITVSVVDETYLSPEYTDFEILDDLETNISPPNNMLGQESSMSDWAGSFSDVSATEDLDDVTEDISACAPLINSDTEMENTEEVRHIPSTVRVTHVPRDCSKDTLLFYFEDGDNGGGPVEKVEIFFDKSTALITFLHSEDAKRIATVRRHQLGNFDVEVTIHLSDNDCGAGIDYRKEVLEVRCLPKFVNEAILRMFLKKHTNTKIMYVDMVINECKAMVEFEHPTGIEDVLKSQPLKINEFDIEVAKVIHEDIPEKLSTADVVSQTLDTNNGEARESTLDNRENHSVLEADDRTNHKLKLLLQTFGIDEKFPGKITKAEAMTIELNPKQDTMYTDLPWILIRNIIISNCDSRDGIIEQCLRDIHEHINENFSPHDIFHVVIQCCDPFVKGILFKKLFLSKIAVPLWFRNPCGPRMIQTWPLRTIVIENKEREYSALDLPTQILTFARIGRPQFSKSDFLNHLLSPQSFNTFYSNECPLGDVKRNISSGCTEIFWYFHENNETVSTVINVRGDLHSDFSESDRNCLARLTDILFLVIDQQQINEKSLNFAKVIRGFKKIVLIIHNFPIRGSDTGDCNRLIENVNDEFKTIEKIELFRGNSPITRRTLSDSIIRCIPNMLKERKSLSEKISAECLILDEIDGTFELTREKVQRCFNSVHDIKDICHIKSIITPAQYIHSKRLSELEKNLQITKNLKATESVHGQINKTLKKQISKLSREFKEFAHTLISFCSTPLSQLQYFIETLSSKYETIIRNKLPKLTLENSKLHAKLQQALKANDPISEQYKAKFEKSKKEIDNIDFRIEHLFREIAYIYEACLRTNTSSEKIGLPRESEMASMMSKIILLGYPFELLDGDSCFVPSMWIKKVLLQIDQTINHERVLSLSVLGIQSSGKSTLLNHMFGSEFKASAGKCTRGIKMQIIPIHDIKTINFKYLLLMDTEGLRAPEMSKDNVKHDGELATFVTGLGDITMLNVMGENRSEITEIMEVVAHAFLRLKLANESIDLKKKCVIIHQNIQDITAKEKMSTGFQNTLRKLDLAATSAAELESVPDVTEFSDIIDFHIDSDTFCFPSLWDGNPPLARVNKTYTDKVLILRNLLLSKTNLSFKTMSTTATHIIDMWNGILSDDFVFTYRNSKDIIACDWFENEFHSIAREMEDFFIGETNSFTDHLMSSSTTLEELEKMRMNANERLKENIKNKKTKMFELTNLLFVNENYGDLLIRQRSYITRKLDLFWKDLEGRVQETLKSEYERSKVKLEISSTLMENENKMGTFHEIFLTSGSKMSDDEFHNRFDEMWADFEQSLLIQHDVITKTQIGIAEIFEAIFNITVSTKDQCTLKKRMKEVNWPTSQIRGDVLQGSHTLIKIDKHDFLKMNQNVNKIILSKLRGTDEVKDLEVNIDSLFSKLDTVIENKCSVWDRRISEQDIYEFVSMITSRMNDIEHKQDIVLTGIFKIKMYIHACSHAHAKFEDHNKKYAEKHYLTAYLRRQREISESCLKSKFHSIDDAKDFSSNFCLIIKQHVHTTVQRRTSEMVFNEIDTLFQQKSRMMIGVVTHLINFGTFDDWLNYIEYPKDHSKNWVIRKCKSHLFLDNSLYVQLANAEAISLLDKIDKALKGSMKTEKDMTMFSWVDLFLTELKGHTFSVKEFFDLRTRFNEKKCALDRVFKFISEEMSKIRGQLLEEIAKTTPESVEWSTGNPYEKVFQSRWGCEERCPYCGEVCIKNSNHDGNHNCLQHRPLGCFGRKTFFLGRLRLTSCHYDVQSGQIHSCYVFGYACTGVKDKKCSDWFPHKYRNYKKYFPTWDIKPSKNQYLTSKVWLWFIAKFKHELARKFCMTIKNVPSHWDTISRDEAIKSYEEIMN